jgi:hypothetical protein
MSDNQCHAAQEAFGWHEAGYKKKAPHKTFHSFGALRRATAQLGRE